MGNLNPDIADRLTPSVPIELTFGAQPVATGKKFSQLFAHKAAAGATLPDYAVYTPVNVGDPAACQAEVDGVAGAGSEAGQMAYAFVAANALAGRSNFPAFRICLMPNGEAHFGSGGEAINAVKGLRCDALVSCYPTEDDTNKATLLALATLISGVDRDLQGQFGSFVHLGSLQALATQEAFADNSRLIVEHAVPDSNTAMVTENGDVTMGSNIIANIASTVGIYPGAQISATGVPGGAVVEQVFVDHVQMSVVATATHAAESIDFQNVVSQTSQELAAACCAAMMASGFPYNPLQGVIVGGMKPPQVPADAIIIDPEGSSEAALSAGLSPLVKFPGGGMGFVRTVTTFTTLPGVGDIRATAYFDWQDLVLMNDFKEDVFQITQLPPFNNNPGGTKASATIAAKLKDEILREAQDYEDLGAFQGVKTLAPQFLVQPSTTSRGRFDFKIPINVIPGLMVIAGNIQGVSGIGDFTL